MVQKSAFVALALKCFAHGVPGQLINRGSSVNPNKSIRECGRKATDWDSQHDLDQ